MLDPFAATVIELLSSCGGELLGGLLATLSCTDPVTDTVDAKERLNVAVPLPNPCWVVPKITTGSGTGAHEPDVVPAMLSVNVLPVLKAIIQPRLTYTIYKVLTLHPQTEAALAFLNKRMAPMLKLSRNALINLIIMQHAVHRGYKAPTAADETTIEK